MTLPHFTGGNSIKNENKFQYSDPLFVNLYEVEVKYDEVIDKIIWENSASVKLNLGKKKITLKLNINQNTKDYLLNLSKPDSIKLKMYDREHIVYQTFTFTEIQKPEISFKMNWEKQEYMFVKATYKFENYE